MKIAKEIFVMLMCFFCLVFSSTVYAGNLTYKYVKDDRSYVLNVYDEDNKLTTWISINLSPKDVGIDESGEFTDVAVEKIQKCYYDNKLSKHVDRLDTILNAESKAGIYGQRKIVSWVVSDKDELFQFKQYSSTTTYYRDRILAYNCNELKEATVKLKTTKTLDDTSVSKLYDEFDLSNVSSGLLTYYDEEFIAPLEEEYESIKTDLQREMNVLDAIINLYSVIEMAEEPVKDENTISIDVGSKYESSQWWEAAQDFFSNAKKRGQDTSAAKSLVDELSDLIFEIGNMIFIIVTSVLGVKYIFASAEGKANIKDSLITLIVAALFFYGWTAIRDLLNIEDLLSTGTLETTAGKIYNTVLFIVNLVAIAGVIWIGVKYMLSSAEGKAQIKTNWGPLILGIIMVYATIRFLTLIIEVVLN